jgi:hypothetical protein
VQSHQLSLDFHISATNADVLRFENWFLIFIKAFTAIADGDGNSSAFEFVCKDLPIAHRLVADVERG